MTFDELAKATRLAANLRQVAEELAAAQTGKVQLWHLINEMPELQRNFALELLESEDQESWDMTLETATNNLPEDQGRMALVCSICWLPECSAEHSEPRNRPAGRFLNVGPWLLDRPLTEDEQAVEEMEENIAITNRKRFIDS
jgi:hypothetical protein